MKNKISFKAIMALVGAVVLILQSFGVRVDGGFVNELATGVGGVLVTLGIVLPDYKKTEKEESEKIEE